MHDLRGGSQERALSWNHDPKHKPVSYNFTEYFSKRAVVSVYGVKSIDKADFVDGQCCHP